MLGALTCIIIGFLFLGTRVFHPHDPAFQFTVYGISGSLLYAVLQFRNIRDFIFVWIFLVALDLILFRVSSFPIIVIRILYIFMIALAIYIYHLFANLTIKKSFVLKPVFLAGLLAILFLAIMLVMSIFLNKPEIRSLPEMRALIEGQTFFGLLIGFGLGIGFELFNVLDKIYLSSTSRVESNTAKEK